MSKISKKLRDRAEKMNPRSFVFLASDLLDAADALDAANQFIEMVRDAGCDAIDDNNHKEFAEETVRRTTDYLTKAFEEN